MKHIITIAASMLILAAPSAFAEKTYITKEINVSEYSAINCNLPCDIEYRQGPASFKISATQNTLDHLVVAVNDGTMKICLDKTKLLNTEDIKIWISSSNLNSVNLNGSIDFEVKGSLTTENFRADLNGTADMEISGLSAKDVAIVANGAAGMDVKNANCNKLETKLNGAGDYDLKNIVCSYLKASLNGAGDCDIEDVECEKLDVTVNGAGGSTITGHAKEANLAVNGVGGINAKQLKADFMNTAMNGIGKISRN